MDKDSLVLKRASASRQSGEWSEDDFDVLAEGIVVGRLFKSLAAPAGMLRRARPRWWHSQKAGGGSEGMSAFGGKADIARGTK